MELLKGAVASRLAADGGQDTPATRRERARELIVSEYQQWVGMRANTGQVRPSEALEDLIFATVLSDLTGGLGRLSPLLARTDVEDIFFTGGDPTWVRLTSGQLQQGPRIAESDDDLVRFLQSIAARTDGGQSSREWNHKTPVLQMRLSEGGAIGARLQAGMDVRPRPQGCIRLHRHTDVSLEQLAAMGMIDRAQLHFLKAAVAAKASILVTGMTGVGKTTLLRALLAEIGFHSVVTTIEDNLELGAHLPVPDGKGGQRNRFAVCNPWEVREGNAEGKGEIGMDQALYASLRESPDWVVVGEVRGGYVLRLLEAASNGAASIMGTIHAKTADEVVNRILVAAGQSARPMQESTVLRTLAGIDLAVHVRRDWQWKRFVSDIQEFGHVSRDTGDIEMRKIFRHRPDDRRGVPTGAGYLSDDLRERLADVGYDARSCLDPGFSSWGPAAPRENGGNGGQGEQPANIPPSDPPPGAWGGQPAGWGGR